MSGKQPQEDILALFPSEQEKGSSSQEGVEEQQAHDEGGIDIPALERIVERVGSVGEMLREVAGSSSQQQSPSQWPEETRPQGVFPSINVEKEIEAARKRGVEKMEAATLQDDESLNAAAHLKTSQVRNAGGEKFTYQAVFDLAMESEANSLALRRVQALCDSWEHEAQRYITMCSKAYDSANWASTSLSRRVSEADRGVSLTSPKPRSRKQMLVDDYEPVNSVAVQVGVSVSGSDASDRNYSITVATDPDGVGSLTGWNVARMIRAGASPPMLTPYGSKGMAVFLLFSALGFRKREVYSGVYSVLMRQGDETSTTSYLDRVEGLFISLPNPETWIEGLKLLRSGDIESNPGPVLEAAHLFSEILHVAGILPKEVMDLVHTISQTAEMMEGVEVVKPDSDVLLDDGTVPKPDYESEVWEELSGKQANEGYKYVTPQTPVGASGFLPRYGHWGGMGHSFGGLPVDKLDDLFRQHDLDYMTAANTLGSVSKQERLDMFKQADNKLLSGLKTMRGDYMDFSKGVVPIMADAYFNLKKLVEGFNPALVDKLNEILHLSAVRHEPIEGDEVPLANPTIDAPPPPDRDFNNPIASQATTRRASGSGSDLFKIYTMSPVRLPPGVISLLNLDGSGYSLFSSVGNLPLGQLQFVKYPEEANHDVGDLAISLKEKLRRVSRRRPYPISRHRGASNFSLLAAAGDVHPQPGPVSFGIDEQREYDELTTLADIIGGANPARVGGMDTRRMFTDTHWVEAKVDTATGTSGFNPDRYLMTRGSYAVSTNGSTQFAEIPPDKSLLPCQKTSMIDATAANVIAEKLTTPGWDTSRAWRVQIVPVATAPLPSGPLAAAVNDAVSVNKMVTSTEKTSTQQDGMTGADLFDRSKRMSYWGASTSTALVRVVAHMMNIAPMSQHNFWGSQQPYSHDIALTEVQASLARGNPVRTFSMDPAAYMGEAANPPQSTAIDPFGQYTNDSSAPSTLGFYADKSSIPMARADYPTLYLTADSVSQFGMIAVAMLAPYPVCQNGGWCPLTFRDGTVRNLDHFNNVKTISKLAIPGAKNINIIVTDAKARISNSTVGAYGVTGLTFGPKATVSQPASGNIMVNQGYSASVPQLLYSLRDYMWSWWSGRSSGASGLSYADAVRKMNCFSIPRYQFAKHLSYAISVVAGFYTAYPELDDEHGARDWDNYIAPFKVDAPGGTQLIAACGLPMSAVSGQPKGALVLPAVEVETLNDIYLGLSRREELGHEQLPVDWNNLGSWMVLEGRTMFAASQLAWHYVGTTSAELTAYYQGNWAKVWTRLHGYDNTKLTSYFASLKRVILEKALAYTLPTDDTGRDVFDAVRIDAPLTENTVLPCSSLTVAQLSSVLNVRLAELWIPANRTRVGDLLCKHDEQSHSFVERQGRWFRKDESLFGDRGVIKKKSYWVWRNASAFTRLIGPGLMEPLSMLTYTRGTTHAGESWFNFFSATTLTFDLDWATAAEMARGTPIIRFKVFSGSLFVPLAMGVTAVGGAATPLTRGGFVDSYTWEYSTLNKNITPALTPFDDASPMSMFGDLNDPKPGVTGSLVVPLSVTGDNSSANAGSFLGEGAASQ